MIPNKMITKFAKAYTKRHIAKGGTKVAKTAWTNDHILFWESPPDFVANHYAAEETPRLDTITILDEMPPLWPVEIRYYDGHTFPYVKMTNSNGHTHWLNGKYVSAALKQAKRQAKNVTFAFCTTETESKSVTGILAQLLDCPLALIATLNEDSLGLEKAPYWQLINNDLPMPIYGGRPEYINPNLTIQFRLL